jgi:Lar family restriction alleviation protein
VDAIEHLRALIGNGAEPMVPDACEDGEYVCHHCDGRYKYLTRPDRYETSHSPDCPWLAAKAFVEEHNRIALMLGAGLLPCPFCGSPAGIRNDQGKSIHFGACCSKCFGELASAFRSEAAAAQAWNRRAI